MPPAVITAALVSAAVGAVTAAVTGGNILKGALLGAVGGAVGSAFLGAGAGASGAAAGDAVLPGALGVDGAMASTGAIEGTALAASEAAGAASGFVGEAPWTPSGGGALDFGSAVPAGVQAPTSLSDMAQTTLAPTGGETTLGGPVAPELSAQAPQPIYQGSSDTSLFNAAKDSQLANEQLGLPADSAMTGPAMPVTQPSAIESMWDRVFGKDGALDRPWANGLVGQALKGAAGGMAEQKKLDFLRQQEELKRQHARFGTQTSRFTPVGLASRATQPYKA